MKKEINYCIKCGKELSKDEKKSFNKKCENCIGKQVKTTKNIVKGIGSVAGALLGVVVFVATKGKKNKF